MKSSIATVSISGTLEGKLRAVAEAGFDAVEIFENDLLSFPGTPRDVSTIIRDLGMKCSLFQPFRDFEGMPDAQHTATFDRAEGGTPLDLFGVRFGQTASTDLTLIIRTHEPQVWFLAEHLAETELVRSDK